VSLRRMVEHVVMYTWVDKPTSRAHHHLPDQQLVRALALVRCSGACRISYRRPPSGLLGTVGLLGAVGLGRAVSCLTQTEPGSNEWMGGH